MTRKNQPGQLSLPMAVDLERIRRLPSFAAALDECILLGGFEPKELPVAESTFSRWKSGIDGIKLPALDSVMTKCQNEVPVIWWLSRHGWDVHSFRKVETETEKGKRLAEERAQAYASALAQQAAENEELRAQLRALEARLAR
jgi:hypothetical protein